MSQKFLNINGKIFSFFVCNFITYSIVVNNKFINSCFALLTTIFISYYWALTNKNSNFKHIDVVGDFFVIVF